MKISIIILLLLMAFLILEAEVILFHQPPLSLPADADSELRIEVQQGIEEIVLAKLFYRQAGSLTYQEKSMQVGSEVTSYLSVQFSDLLDYRAGLEYYLEVYGENDILLVTLPEIRPELNPFRITVELESDVTDAFVLLSPDKEYQDESDGLIVAVSLFAISDQLDFNQLRLLKNGKDITVKSQISRNLLIFKDSQPDPGTHTYQITGKLNDGSSISSPVWEVFVKGDIKETDFNISGRGIFNARLKQYKTETPDNTDTDRWADFLLRMNGNYRILDFNARLFLSSLETSSAQAVNRYSLTMAIPHLEVTAGDYTANYSDFTVYGKNIRGFHGKLHFKGFNLQTSIGQTRRNVDGKAYSDTTAAGDEFTDYRSAAFKRNTITVRTEFGSKNSLMWGLNFVKARDKVSSLKEKYYLSYEDSLPTVTPKDNVVIGTDARLALMNQRLVWGFETAISLYNNNIIGGALSKDSLEAEFETDLPFDPEDFEDFFIINKNVEPIIPNLSNLAYKTYLKFFYKHNLLNIAYSATGSSYNSIAANYVPKDARIFSIYDNFSLLANRLNINLGLNLIRDNVYDEKDITTKTANYFIQLIYRPYNYPYFGLGFNHNVSENNFKSDPDNEDTLTDRRYDIKTGNINFNVGYEIKSIESAPTSLTFSVNSSFNKDDVNESFYNKRNYLTLGAVSRFRDLPLVTQLTYSLTLNDNEFRNWVDTNTLSSEREWSDPVSEKSVYHSIFLKAEMNFLDNTLKPFLETQYTIYGGDIDSQRLQMFNIGAAYQMFARTFLSAETGFKFYQNNDQEESDYSRFNLKFRISQKF